MVSFSLVVFSAIFALATAANKAVQCPGRSFPNLAENVEVSCKGNPCKLKKNTDISVVIKFKPEKDVPDVINDVSAEVFGVPLPFVGVNGNSICDKIETESGEKASCPLKGGTTYVYKDSFPILPVYPTISVKVHWALKASNKELHCFEIPARIV